MQAIGHKTTARWWMAAALVIFGQGCGGGGGGGDAAPPAAPESPVPTSVPTTYDESRQTVFQWLNHWRTSCGWSALQSDSLLDSSVQYHAEYLRVERQVSHEETNSQNPFFTGQTLRDRAVASGYEWRRVTEVVAGSNSGSYFAIAGNNDGPVKLDTSQSAATKHLQRLFSAVYHMQGVLSDDVHVGIGFSSAGNISTNPAYSLYWDVLSINTATPLTQSLPQFEGVRSFPCTGITDVLPIFYPENPNPKPDNDQFANPLGHPVMLQASSGGNLTLTQASFTSAAGEAVDFDLMTSANDPHQLVPSNEVFLIPTRPLQPNTRYEVNVVGTDSVTGSFTRNIQFQTGTQ